MTDERDELERVATAVADGNPVDWDSEDQANRQLKGKLDQLRAIEKIAEVHRTPPARELTPSAEEKPTVTFNPPMIDAPVSALPFTRWKHLEVGELIGRGGFGEVYRARDTSLQKDVALKLVRADRVSDAGSTTRFLLEARRLARVTHENVLQVHGADVDQGRAGWWADLIKGRTLEQILQEEGRRSWEEATLIGRRMCMALAAVHAVGLIHHDVKTGNIMRGEGGHYVLMDFSTTIDRLASPPDSNATDAAVPSGKDGTKVDLHAAIGTPAFMAPERFVRKDSGASADVYSLGVVLYRLVSGSFPVEGKNAGELFDMHRRRESKPLRDLRPDLPEGFIRVVERALESDPAERFQSMGEMDRALAELNHTARRSEPLPQPEPSPPPGPIPASEPPRLPSRAWWRNLFDSTPVRVAMSLALVAAIAIASIWPPTPLEVDARIYRTTAVDDRLTSRVAEPLKSGAKVAPGDRLYLEIKGNDRMYLYVLNHDEAGVAWLLFPLPDLDIRNPLPRGTSHRLPGTRGGDEIYWVVSSAGGEEEFVVIASLDPLNNFERQIAAVPPAGSTASSGEVALSRRGIGTLRGIGGLEEAGQTDEGDVWRPLAGIVDGIRERAASDGSLWAWTIRLQGPEAGDERP